MLSWYLGKDGGEREGGSVGQTGIVGEGVGVGGVFNVSVAMAAAEARFVSVGVTRMRGIHGTGRFDLSSEGTACVGTHQVTGCELTTGSFRRIWDGFAGVHGRDCLGGLFGLDAGGFLWGALSGDLVLVREGSSLLSCLMSEGSEGC